MSMTDEQVKGMCDGLKKAFEPITQSVKKQHPNQKIVFFDASAYWKAMKSQVQ